MISNIVLPKQIYIIRHADKQINLEIPEPPFGIDIEGNRNYHSLIPRGWQRAGALIGLFDPVTKVLSRDLERPTSLFSPLFGTLKNTKLQRTYQTIIGLAERLNIKINNLVSVGEEEELAWYILNAYTDVILISWEHHHIPILAKEFPTINSTDVPQVWPDDRFDVIWSFTLDNELGQYIFSQMPQQLLAGDTDTVIPVQIN